LLYKYHAKEYLRQSGLNIAFPRSNDFLWYWLPPLAWGGTVLLMSGDLGSGQHTGVLLEWLLSWFPVIPSTWWELIHLFVRKTIGHFGSYAFLYFLWFRAIRGQLGWTSGLAFLLAMAVCLSVALLDEGHQFMHASRIGSLQDVALDMSGVLTAALLAKIFWTPRNKRQPKNELSKPTLRG